MIQKLRRCVGMLQQTGFDRETATRIVRTALDELNIEERSAITLLARDAIRQVYGPSVNWRKVDKPS